MGQVEPLEVGRTHQGDAAELMGRIPTGSVDLSLFAPPPVGDGSFEGWEQLLTDVLTASERVIKPGGFVAVIAADVLAFPDEDLPRFQADVVGAKRSAVTYDMVMGAIAADPTLNHRQLADLLGCSEQTIARRLGDNNVRVGELPTQTRVKPIAGVLETIGAQVGLPLYDRRVWVKEPVWGASRWHASSYRAVEDLEHVLVFWKPGITTVDRSRLQPYEWTTWGSRGVWNIHHDQEGDHERRFPIVLARRLIRLLTDPDALILDPFMGTGTTGVAAIELGREFIGIEADASWVDAANRNAVAVAQEPTLF